MATTNPPLRDRRGFTYTPAIGPRLKPLLWLVLGGFALLGANGVYLASITALAWFQGGARSETFFYYLMFVLHLVLGFALLLPFLRERAPGTPTVASVCTGAFLLGRAGLLDGRRATTHTQALPALRAEFPDVDVVGGKIVDEGSIVSAAGVSSGIDLALHLLERWFGPDARARAAKGLDGPWA